MTDDLPATTKTTCPYCGVGCGVLATKELDGSVSIKGDPDHPANFGRLCSKGSALGETVDLDGRLLEPQISGEAADWDVALDLVAEKFSQAIEQYGPDSVAFYVSGQILTEDYYVGNKLMKGFIGSANIDTNSRLCMASSVAGHRRAFGADTVPGTYEDLEIADLVVLTGSNLAWCHPVIYQRIAAAKAKRPEMKVVLIDPRRTMTADIADIHLPIKADGDVALFMGLLAHLEKTGVINTDYIENYTEGFDAALAESHNLSVAEIAAITALSEAEIAEFYTLWAATDKVVTVYSQGVNQSCFGTDKVNAIINCHLATGRIGRHGMGPFSITGQPNAMGGREVGGLANMLAAHMAIENPEHRDRVKRFWNAPNIAEKAGLKAVDMFDAVADGRIKAIWIMATNPVDSMPNADKVAAALKACPFVVVSDIMSKTDTTQYAHVKLPSLAWGEKDGTVTNSERRVSHQKAFLPAPKNTKADWWQMAEVAKRMGFLSAFSYCNASDIFREYAEQTAFENDGARDLDLGAYANISDAEYSQLQPFQWPQPKGKKNPNSETRFFADGGFFTPNGKGQFIKTPVINGDKSDQSQYPFLLNTGRIRDHWHTMTRTGKSARLSGHIAEPFVEIHPEDAFALGLRSADLVQIDNQLGSIIVRSKITDAQPLGSVFVPMHWTNQWASSARVDCLVPATTDRFSGQPALKMAHVNISKFSAQSFGFLVSKEKPNLSQCNYWALAKTHYGWRSEFAQQTHIARPDSFMAQMFGYSETVDCLQFEDANSGMTRLATFEGQSLKSALYLATGPVTVSRNWAADQLGQQFTQLSDRWRIVAARPANDMPDKGAIICSCMNVGMNEIINAVKDGCLTTEAIGQCTKAGTNCGSCVSEVRIILNEHQIIAAE